MCALRHSPTLYIALGQIFCVNVHSEMKLTLHCEITRKIRRKSLACVKNILLHVLPKA